MRLAFLATILFLTACSRSETDQETATAGPYPSSGQVSIYRDQWGVPHIYSSEEENGFFGLGYAMAADQLERLLLYVLLARGEVAANVVPERLPPQLRASFTGPGEISAAEMIERDYQIKLWRIREHAADAINRLDPQLKLNYERFAEGINSYRSDHPDRNLDWAIGEVSLLDVFTVPHAVLWSFYQAGIGTLDCTRAGATLKTALGSPPGVSGGLSNQWAVMPHRTTTGGAILLTDPHGGIDGRFSYEYRLHAGDLHSAGYALGPMLIVARNQHVGWALTTGSPDVADCYRVETLPDDDQAYLFDDETRKMETREIRVAVRDRENVTVQARYTRHNGLVSPVVAEGENHVFVVSTPYLSNLEGFHHSLYRMNLARNVDDFKEAQRGGAVFPQNLLAADTSGDIMYIHAGLTPVRPNPDLDWTQPVNGNSSEYSWQGIHSIDDLVVIKSPPSGYLQNNNIDPRFMDISPHPELDGKPEYVIHGGIISRENTNGRAVRALDVLTTTDKLSEQDAFDLAFDVTLVKSKNWIGLLENSSGSDGESADDIHSAFIQDLLTFDGRLHQSSTAALKFVYWRESLRFHVKADQLGELVDSLEGKAQVSETLKESLTTAVADAAARLSENPQGLRRTYGDEFRIGGGADLSWPLSGGTLRSSFFPPLGEEGQPVNECNAGRLLCPMTLFAMYHAPPDDNQQRIAVAGSRIMRIDFYSPDGIRSYSLNNPGISDDPLSPHYNDQARKLMSRQEMKPVYFEWEDLETNVASTVTLQAAPRGQ